MYAVVRSGGHQHKVAVGDVVTVDKLADEIGASVKLTPVMLVDGSTVTTGADKLADASVSAEVLGDYNGPKISILKFKNKTGYRKRQGHRQHYTRVKITDIKA